MADPVTAHWIIPGTSISVRNRTVLAAMTNKQSHEDGTLSDEEIHWLLRRAEGGFGIVTTAASHVHPSGKSWEGEMGVWGDHHIPRLELSLIHISEPTRQEAISYAVFCLKKKKQSGH